MDLTTSSATRGSVELARHRWCPTRNAQFFRRALTDVGVNKIAARHHHVAGAPIGVARPGLEHPRLFAHVHFMIPPDVSETTIVLKDCEFHLVWSTSEVPGSVPILHAVQHAGMDDKLIVQMHLRAAIVVQAFIVLAAAGIVRLAHSVRGIIGSPPGLWPSW